MVEVMHQKWFDDLEDLLQCPICFERPKNQIFQCNEGHHICDGCRQKLTLCPFCNGQWSESRNRLAESLCQKIDVMKWNLTALDGEINKLMKENVSTAQNAIGASANVPRNVYTRPQGRYRCFFTSCTAYLNYGPLLQHISAKHPHEFLKLEQRNNSIDYTWTLDSRRNIIFDRAFRDDEMRTFYLKLSGDAFGDWFAGVYMIHNAATAWQFAFELRINTHEYQIWTCRGQVISCRNSRYPSTRHSVIALPKAMHPWIFGGIVVCNVRIYKKA